MDKQGIKTDVDEKEMDIPECYQVKLISNQSKPLSFGSWQILLAVYIIPSLSLIVSSAPFSCYLILNIIQGFWGGFIYIFPWSLFFFLGFPLFILLIVYPCSTASDRKIFTEAVHSSISSSAIHFRKFVEAMLKLLPGISLNKVLFEPGQLSEKNVIINSFAIALVMLTCVGVVTAIMQDFQINNLTISNLFDPRLADNSLARPRLLGYLGRFSANQTLLLFLFSLSVTLIVCIVMLILLKKTTGIR